MLIALVALLIAYLALLLFRQDIVLDVEPILICIGAVLIMSSAGMKIMVEAVKEELEKQNPHRKYKDWEVDTHFISDTKLAAYNIVYFLLFSFLAIELYLGIENHYIILRVLLPLIALILFDLVFFLKYCTSQIINTRNIVPYFIYHESRFLYKGFWLVLKVIGFMMCLPFMIISVIIEIINAFL